MIMLQKGSKKIVKADQMLSGTRTQATIDASPFNGKRSSSCLSSDSILEANLQADLSIQDMQSVHYTRSNTKGRSILFLDEDHRIPNYVNQIPQMLLMA